MGAALGAVVVGAGAALVREPRLPEEPPKPARASASAGIRAKAPAKRRTDNCRIERGPNTEISLFNPAQSGTHVIWVAELPTIKPALT